MNIKTIAKMANVSSATVSRALNGKNVRPNAYERIMKAVEVSGYVPNDIGRNLRMQRSNKLLVLIPTINNSFYSKMVNAFEIRARDMGFNTLFGITNRNPDVEHQYIDMLFSKQVDGLASFVPTLDKETVDTIARNYPFVAMCWRGDSGENVNYVCIDNAQASYDVVKYLQSLGHKNIAIMNCEDRLKKYEIERLQGFNKAMNEAGITIPKEYYQVCEDDFQDGYNACKYLMELPNPPTAIFTASDTRATGAVRYLNDHGLTAGKDVDIVGFDNLEISKMIRPEITTVSQPRKEIGDEAASLLIQMINNRNQVSRGIILQHRLIIRETTRKNE